ncbi:hypothetical protein OsI_06529 [Oryza sativa Indica Group]|uniref:Late embryogenesis abundant protein LEA-2 subgroup domain-containing protein n=1 Tax=Oryza sativa subsp. indica TaxID=39946 RepID=B8AEX4_ORYSI|nr:hypothetical protein OsI_06529 [Oryza sativa Indica Group]
MRDQALGSPLTRGGLPASPSSAAGHRGPHRCAAGRRGPHRRAAGHRGPHRCAAGRPVSWRFLPLRRNHRDQSPTSAPTTRLPPPASWRFRPQLCHNRLLSRHQIHPVGVGSLAPAPDSQQQVGKGRSTVSYGEKEQLPITAPRPYAPAPLPPPPPRRRSRGRRCCRCVCWTLLAVLVLAVALGATAGILYAVFKPKIPDFRVNRLTVTRFDVNATAATVSDAFEVEVTSTNPNRRIGMYYDGLEVTASFHNNGTELCRGGFPALYQGHRSTVRPVILLVGEAAAAATGQVRAAHGVGAHADPHQVRRHQAVEDDQEGDLQPRRRQPRHRAGGSESAPTTAASSSRSDRAL